MLPLLEANDLYKLYNSGTHETHAVNGISFTVSSGEKIAITGPSGCGKTTLINLLGCITRPTGGTVLLEGKNVSKLNDAALAQYRNHFFGYIVQDYALIETCSVYENIEIPLLYTQRRLAKKERKHRVSNLLERVDLLVKINEKVKNLSGGQRQRVAIARAIINKPRIILADEPTGSLDSETGHDIMALLNQLVQDGATLIMVTHNQALAEDCRRRLHMIDGAIEKDSAW